MAFMDRARAFYQRGDAVRAAFVLAEGVKRHPHHEEGLHQFLRIYVEDLERTGLEQEVIRVLGTQPNGDELLDIVVTELRSRSQFDRVTALERVSNLRDRAAEARERLAPTAPRIDDDFDLEAIPRRTRRRRRSQARSQTSQEAPAETSVASPVESAVPVLPPPRQRTRRRRSAAKTGEAVPQGILDLQPPPVPKEEDWSRFTGVHKKADEIPAAPAKPRRRRRRTARTQPTEPAKPAAPPPTPSSVKQVSAVVEEEPPRMPRLPHSLAMEGVNSELPLDSPAGVGETAEHFTVPTGENDGAESGGPLAAQLLPVEADEWSFGDDQSDSEAPALPPTKPSRRSRRVRAAHGLRKLSQLGPPPVGAAVRATARTFRGRRGIVFLGLLLGLGLTGAAYRACSGVVQTQLTEAELAFSAGDGDALLRAVGLYEDNLEGEHTAMSERADFARALLATDYGKTYPAPEYPADEMFTEFGGAAVALSALATGDLQMAGEALQETLATHGDRWAAHWVAGRLAVEQAQWDTAQNAFARAHELDETAVLPLAGLADLALRAGDDSQARVLIDAVAALNPDHPLVALGSPIIAYGLDPLTAESVPLDVVLPDPAEQTLSARELELVTYVRARQALAARELDGVVRALRHLRTVSGSGLGVRVGLLDALIAGRSYQLELVMAALERAAAGCPAESPAARVVSRVGVEILSDLGRPDLALERIGDGGVHPMRRAELLVDVGEERAALRALGQLMNEGSSQRQALRVLVDFHLRRGVPDRARLRASGLPAEDSPFAAARIALSERRFTDARDAAQDGLRANPNDRETLRVLAIALAHLGVPEQAMEHIDRASSDALLTGWTDRLRLEVLVASARAPREVLVEFIGSLDGSEPTSMRTLPVLARAYEAIGDHERAIEIAHEVLARERNHQDMHALLGRLLAAAGDPIGGERHAQLASSD